MNKKIFYFLLIIFSHFNQIFSGLEKYDHKGGSNHFDGRKHRVHNRNRTHHLRARMHARRKKYQRPWASWWWWQEPAYFYYPLNGYLWTDTGWVYNKAYKKCVRDYYKKCKRKNRALSKPECREKAVAHCYEQFNLNVNKQ